MAQHETEVKLEVRNPRALRRRVAGLGFRRVIARHFESNILFDFSDLRLHRTGRLLRLRFANGRSLLTYKGAPRRSLRYKIRHEVEAEVADGERLRAILKGLGLREVFRYDKYRTVFAEDGAQANVHGPVLVYDETPIGNYVELEGPARWIDGVARRLGYRPHQYITVSYGTLYRQRRRKRGMQAASMTFRGRKS